MEGFWELNVIQTKYPAHTGSFLNGYNQGEFTDEEVAAREGGQNSLDAGKDVKGITELNFHKLSISGDQKAELLKLFDFEKILNKERLAIFDENSRDSFFVSNVKDFLHKDTISALLIRDFNTCGLGGAWNEFNPTDHFARLVYALGLDDKDDGDSNTGGSFGLGKTVYAKSSLIRTVIYHSTFNPTDTTNNVNRRLMASGVYPRHNYNKINYGGFAYFGKKDPNNLENAMPFENEEARDWWQKICDLFEIDTMRTDEQHGTDVLILMDNLKLSAIKKAVEDYYFPAIIDSKLSVKFFDEDGNLDLPKPLERKDLDQFIRLTKDITVGSDEENLDNRQIKNLKRFGVGDNKIGMGRVAFEAAEEDEASSDKSNCVAIMRGTGMIINYLKLGSERYEPAVGAFVADEDVRLYLKESENPAHSEWNKHSYRLKQKFPDYGEKLVGRVNSSIKNGFINFQKSLQPEVSSTRSESGLLARLLSGTLAGSPGDRPVPRGETNPVSISLKQKKRREDISVWRLVIEDNKDTPEKPFNLRLCPSISLAGDSKKIAIKHMIFSVKTADGKLLKQEEKPELEFEYKRNETKLDLNIEFDNPGQKNYIVQCKCIYTKEIEQ